MTVSAFKSFGFSLIELMVVLAVAAVLLKYGLSVVDNNQNKHSIALAKVQLTKLMSHYRNKNLVIGGDNQLQVIEQNESLLADYQFYLSNEPHSFHGVFVVAKPQQANLPSLYLYESGQVATDLNRNGTVEYDEHCWRC